MPAPKLCWSKNLRPSASCDSWQGAQTPFPALTQGARKAQSRREVPRSRQSTCLDCQLSCSYESKTALSRARTVNTKDGSGQVQAKDLPESRPIANHRPSWDNPLWGSETSGLPWGAGPAAGGHLCTSVPECSHSQPIDKQRKSRAPLRNRGHSRPEHRDLKGAASATAGAAWLARARPRGADP